VPELAIQVRGAEPIRTAAAPAIGLRLEISNTPATQTIQTVVLNCLIQIEASRRRYGGAEQSRLRDLFGEPERWGQTLRPLLWTNLTTTVPAFTGSVEIQLAVPCTFDLNVTPTKYFHGVEGDAVPLSLLFSGTIFYRTDDNGLQAAPIPWSTEARFALPPGIWKDCIDLCHPNTAWLELRRDVFERLYEFKVRQGLATFDEALEQMMENAMQVEA
jgi:Family of unknown function (DUF6084)